MFPRVSNFPAVFSEYNAIAAIPGGGNASLLSLAESSGIFLCRQIGLLRSQLVPQKRARPLASAARIFSPIPLFGRSFALFSASALSPCLSSSSSVPSSSSLSLCLPDVYYLFPPPLLLRYRLYHLFLLLLLSRSRISKCCAVVKTTNSDGKPLVTEGASAVAAGDFSNSDGRHLARPQKRMSRAREDAGEDPVNISPRNCPQLIVIFLQNRQISRGR